MQKNSQTVMIAKTLQDVFYHKNTVDSLQIVGGCTDIKKLEEKALTIRFIDDLKGYEKKERYIDFGPAISLNEMLNIGSGKIPDVLYQALSTIANSAVRNLATLGGNIFAQGVYHTLWAPLLALDAKLEFKKENESKIIPMNSFYGIPEGFILTKVRVPLDEYELAIFRRLGPASSISPLSAGFVFLADTEKNLISNIKIAFAGPILFRSRDLENRLLGEKLPISEATIKEVLEDASHLYDGAFDAKEAPSILKAQFLKLLYYALKQLA